MKNLAILIFFTLLTTNLCAQEFIDKLDNEFCTCVSKENNYTDKTFENCSEQIIPKYQKDLEKLYNNDSQTNDFDKGVDDGKDFMKDFMLRLIKKCDAFYYHMTELRKLGINSFKKEYEKITIESLSLKFKESQSINDYWEMANWNFSHNKYIEAEKMYIEILKNEPDQLESAYMLALLYDEIGEYKKAKTLYETVYEKYPKIEYKLYSEMDSRKIK